MQAILVRNERHVSVASTSVFPCAAACLLPPQVLLLFHEAGEGLGCLNPFDPLDQEIGVE